MGKYCIGVDIGGTTVKIGLFTDKGNVKDKWEIVTRKDEGGSFILSDIAASVDEKLAQEKITKKDVLGIGLGIPGPITADGTVLKCVNLGWGIFNVAEEVKKLTGIFNVKVGNDANVAALGEMWQGGGKGYKNLVMMTLGTGVGGGIIIGGEIVTGAHGAGGEIGQSQCGCPL